MTKITQIIAGLTDISLKTDTPDLPIMLHITIEDIKNSNEKIEEFLVPIEAIGLAKSKTNHKEIVVLKGTINQNRLSIITRDTIAATQQSVDKCFTQDQLNTCLEIVRSTPAHQQAKAICEKVLCPEVMKVIDSATGQKNDQKFVAYTLIHLLSKIK